MGDEATTTTPAAAPTASLAEVNSQYLQGRADRLNVALQKAMDSKAAGAVSASTGKGKPSSPAKAAPAAATPLVEPASTTEQPASLTGDADPAPEENPSDPAAEPDEATSDEAAPSADLTKLQELGRKKDLRALEKELGLEEGSLGVHNGSWAAYRRRVEEVEARETKHGQDQQTLIDRFGPTVALHEQAGKGNLQAFAGLIERTTGVPIDKFVEFWAKNVTQLDPQTLELQRENARLRALHGAPPPADKPAPAGNVAEATAKADAYIQEEAGKHPAFKLQGAKEGIRQIWLASHDPKTKGFGLTPQQAAGEFMKQRKAQIERESWITSGKKPPAANTPRTRSLSRNGAAESQPRKENLTREQLIERGAEQWKRLKAAGKA